MLLSMADASLLLDAEGVEVDLKEFVDADASPASSSHEEVEAAKAEAEALAVQAQDDPDVVGAAKAAAERASTLAASMDGPSTLCGVPTEPVVDAAISKALFATGKAPRSV